MESFRNIIKRTPIIKEQYTKYLSDFKEYSVENKREVKFMYRWFLKTIPTLYTRKL